MATDLFALLGPPTPEQARRLVLLLGLAPGQRQRSEAAEKPLADTARRAA